MFVTQLYMSTCKATEYPITYFKEYFLEKQSCNARQSGDILRKVIMFRQSEYMNQKGFTHENLCFVDFGISWFEY